MATDSRTCLSGANGLFNKVKIRDLDQRPQESRLRELDADAVLVVAGGAMASRTTCSCGCADDCGYTQ